MFSGRSKNKLVTLEQLSAAVHYPRMVTARSLLPSLLIAASIIGSAWWLVRSQPAPDRFQLANVGGGEAIRLDKLTGTMTRCYEGTCETLTQGERIVAKPGADAWAEIAEPPSD